MIRPCRDDEVDAICAVINDAAEAYRGVIPADCFHEPYMPSEELGRDIASGVRFSGVEEDGALVAVMGLQPLGEVCLIRHAYVLRTHQRRGIAGALLARLRAEAGRPLLVGTWAAASWAIAFYRKHGFELVGRAGTEALLRRYWSVPERQIANSVVLAEPGWRALL